MSQSLTVIAGRYRLESLIGEGGMASVWRAKDLTLARPVAVKLLYARDDRDRGALVSRFLREARIAAAVQHRNVIHIVDFGTTETGQPYMVMELLEGESLGDRLHREGRLPIAEVVHIASMTLRGLAAVHEAGIIHRDLKPDNIFLKEEGGVVYPKILDFGISRSVEPASGRRSALTTDEGIIVGTPEYMSPEQARGLREFNHRTDIYSMGVILYQALTGALPFQSENVGDLIIKIVTGTAPPVHELAPEVPLAFSELVSRAMSRAAADRFTDATQMQAALIAGAEGALGEALRRSLSDMPPGLTSPVSPAPKVPRGGQLLSREFALTTGDVLPAAAEADEADEATPAAKSNSQEHVATQEIVQGISRRRWVWPVLGATALVGVAAAVLWSSPTAQKPPAPAVVVTQLPPPIAAAQPRLVSVHLHNVPKGAAITVDGRSESSNTFTLPRDEQAHTLLVSAPGKAPWQVVYNAVEDRSYDVVLQDTVQPATPAAPATQVPSALHKPKRAGTGTKSAGKSPAAPRHLDF